MWLYVPSAFAPAPEDWTSDSPLPTDLMCARLR